MTDIIKFKGSSIFFEKTRINPGEKVQKKCYKRVDCIMRFAV